MSIHSGHLMKSNVHLFLSVFGLHHLLMWLFSSVTLHSVHHPVTHLNAWYQIQLLETEGGFFLCRDPAETSGGTSGVVKCAKTG